MRVPTKHPTKPRLAVKPGKPNPFGWGGPRLTKEEKQKAKEHQRATDAARKQWKAAAQQVDKYDRKMREAGSTFAIRRAEKSHRAWLRRRNLYEKKLMKLSHG